MNKDLKYYRIHRSNNDSIPLVSEDEGCPFYLYKKKPIDDPKMMQFKFAEPIPRKPVMADYHSSPSCIVSKKFYDILKPIQIEGVQLLPARIRGLKDDFFEDYWAIHVYNVIKCVNPELSDCQIDEHSISSVNKIILDESILVNLPLSQRLIFRLKEDRAYILFHSSLADAILNLNLVGVKFTNINSWSDRSFFEVE